MKRTIKFRGKRADNGEWIYGYLADDDYINNVNEIAMPSEEVASSTVSQFTGLFGYKAHHTPDMVGAKADQEAYYGDIIRFVDTDGRTFVKELWWSEELQCTMVGNLPYYRLHESGYIQPSKLVFQIVGNIHDNPELLKTEQQC